MTAYLRLFNPEDHSDDWTLPEFAQRWFFPHLTDRRRPVQPGTLARYHASIQWWEKLMPPVRVSSIQQGDLDAFRDRLAAATYRRGHPLHSPARTLADATRFRVLSDISTILRKAGPQGAKLHPSPPANPEETPVYWPKATWTLGEARTIAAAIDTAPVPLIKVTKPYRFSPAQMRAMLRVIVALWGYTGHRASTWRMLTWHMLKEPYPGQWVLEIRHSVKTRKPDRIAVHPALLAALEQCRGLDPLTIIPLPISARTLYDWHGRLLLALPPDRRFSPQSWRRWHAEQLSLVGLAQVQAIASAALSHSSAAVTAAHYFAAKNALIGLLPSIFD